MPGCRKSRSRQRGKGLVSTIGIGLTLITDRSMPRGPAPVRREPTLPAPCPLSSIVCIGIHSYRETSRAVDTRSAVLRAFGATPHSFYRKATEVGSTDLQKKRARKLGKRVLLVEDQFLIRLLMAESLADDGFDVLEADDGDQAISLIASLANCDLLITDIQMPGQSDGNAVARTAKAKFSGLPTVYMTGNPASVSQLLEPWDLVMKKPFNPEELMAAVIRLVPSPGPRT